jgi:hypothetical protein
MVSPHTNHTPIFTADTVRRVHGVLSHAPHVGTLRANNGLEAPWLEPLDASRTAPHKKTHKRGRQPGIKGSWPVIAQRHVSSRHNPSMHCRQRGSHHFRAVAGDDHAETRDNRPESPESVPPHTEPPQIFTDNGARRAHGIFPDAPHVWTLCDNNGLEAPSLDPLEAAQTAPHTVKHTNAADSQESEAAGSAITQAHNSRRHNPSIHCRQRGAGHVQAVAVEKRTQTRAE